MGVIERTGVDLEKQVADIVRRIEVDGIETVRFAFPDQHGVLRGKTLVAAAAVDAIRDGVMAPATLIAKDTASRTVFPTFGSRQHALEGLYGAGDLMLVADPTTFKILPWSPTSGWILCDAHLMDGRPNPFDTRNILRAAVDGLARRGWQCLTGLEIEFHIFKRTRPELAAADIGQPGAAPEVSHISRGYQFLAEQRYDEIEPILDVIRRDVQKLGLPLRSIEVEYGPSQCECTFGHRDALASADAMILFRSAVKQICQRAGYHATFMCRPHLPNIFSSGWHLHQSLKDTASGASLFSAGTDDRLLSPLGEGYLAGLIAHAGPATVFSTPTINGYKRYRPNSLAPDRATWARDNRGVMVRVVGGGTDPATRLENRAGEPLANPYLYMATQIASGLDGVDRSLTPPPATERPYEDQHAAPLPDSLASALRLLRDDGFFAEALGQQFTEYYLQLKTAEVERFQKEVTDWEQREYFEAY